MQSDFNQSMQEISCVQCKKFFGNPKTANMCSVCFKKTESQNLNESQNQQESINIQSNQIQEEKKVEVVEKPAEKVSSVNKQSDPTRCKQCNRKVGYTGIKCRCEEIFCAKHRFSEDHNCKFNYKDMQKEKLAKENFVVKQKMEKFQ